MKTILDVQKFWDSRPCNSRHSMSPIMRQYSDEVTERKYFVEPHVPEFAEFEKWRSKRVLEIGCGIGTDTLEFAKAGATVFAVDLSEKSIEIARARAVSCRTAGIKFYHANAEQFILPVNRGHFDAVYAFGSIHHSPNPDAILDNARYFIKDGGTLKIMVYNKYSWKSLWVLLKYGHGKFWKFRELIAKYSEAQTGCPVTHVYSPKELRELCERNGFIVRKLYKAHIFKFDIEDYKNYKYTVAQPWKWMPAKMFSWFERHFGWHLLCEAQAC